MSPDPPKPRAVCDGGDLDCGSGLLLIIREAMAPLDPGDVLEVRSREASVAVDLPAWCRMVGHELVGSRPGEGRSTSFFVGKRGEDEDLEAHRRAAREHEWSVRVRAAGERTSARVYARNHAFTVGQSASFDTADDAPSAVEYLLGALGGCLAAGMRWRASRRAIPVRQLEVVLSGQAEDILVLLGIGGDGHPGLARVTGRVFVDADADDDVLDELWAETLAGSPLVHSLARPVQLEIERRSL